MHVAGTDFALNEAFFMSLVRCVFAWAIPVQAGFDCPSHAHGCTEIVYSDRSEGVLSQGGYDYSYRHGSVFVYQPGGTHRVENKSPGEHICVGVIGCGARELAAGVWSANRALAVRFGEIRDVLKKNPSLQAVRLDLLAGLIVCDLTLLTPNHPRAPTRKSPLSRAHQVREYIESTLHERLSLTDMAKRVYVSPDYLRQLLPGRDVRGGRSRLLREARQSSRRGDGGRQNGDRAGRRSSAFNR